MSRIYTVAHPDGQSWYYLVPDNYNFSAWLADDTAMTHHGVNGRWRTSTHRAERAVVGVKHGGVKVLGYTLLDPETLSARFPAELTAEEWAARSEMERDVMRPLYDRRTEDIPGERVEFPADTVIDLGTGQPVPADGLAWTAELPFELAHHREVQHLFPGHLDGFRGALCSRLKQLGFTAYDQGTFSVSARVRYSPKREEWRGALLRSGERSKHRGAVIESYTTRHVDISPPRRIHGANRAEAVEQWNLLMDGWVAAITEWAEPHECGHCGGTGLIPPTTPGSAS